MSTKKPAAAARKTPAASGKKAGAGAKKPSRVAADKQTAGEISAAYRQQLSEDRTKPAKTVKRKGKPQSATVVATSSANSSSADPDARHRALGERVSQVTRHI